jgi:hypothetical protein
LGSLEKVPCHIECEIKGPTEGVGELNFHLYIAAPYRGLKQVNHAVGVGILRRQKGQLFIADIELSQSMPLAVDDKASLSLSLIKFKPGSDRPIETLVSDGKVAIKQGN